MGQLVTDFRFLANNPYSSWVRSTGPKGSLRFFEEKPWTVNRPRLETGLGCLRRSCALVLAASEPIPFHPHSKVTPERL